MNSNNPLHSAIDMLERSPQFAGNQNAMQMLDCIKKNDSKRGQQIAENLCKTYGVTPEQAIQQARRFFGMG